MAPTAALARLNPWSPAPERVDAFTGIIDPNALARSAEGPLGKVSELNVAMVLSENTKRQIAWSNELTAGIGTSLMVGRRTADRWTQVSKRAFDPKFITDSVMQPLVRRFHSLEVISDIGKFHEGNYDLLIILDVSFLNHLNTPILFGSPSLDSGTTLNAYFIDRHDAMRDKVEATLTKKAPWTDENTLQIVLDVRAEVLSQYKEGLTGIFGPEQDPNAIRADPTGLPVEERLRRLDELARKGLITEEEAAAKRAEILKGL